MRLTTLPMAVSLLLLTSTNLSAQDDPFADSGSTATIDPFAVADDQRGTDPIAVPLKKSVQSGQNDLPDSRSKRNPGIVNRQAAELRIRSVLDHSASHHFQDTPLVEAVRVLRETHNIPIILDARALETLGLSVEEPVSISLENVALRSFLRLMLGGLDATNLTYMVKDEVLKITSKEVAEQSLRVDAYRLDNALDGQAEQVIAALQQTLNPSEWTTEGGSASTAAILGNVIVVSATETLHEQVQDFLDKVQSALEK